METKSKQRGVPVLEHVEPAIEKLFVYGIFLDESNRKYYGMENPSYDTVQGYMTVGGYIVKAIKSNEHRASLTGLLVDVPARKLPFIDVLEAGYHRIRVNTTSGFDAFMYASPSTEENYNSYRSDMYEPIPGQE